MVYLPTFTIKNHPNVGKYPIHGWYGYGWTASRDCFPLQTRSGEFSNSDRKEYGACAYVMNFLKQAPDPPLFKDATLAKKRRQITVQLDRKWIWWCFLKRSVTPLLEWSNLNLAWRDMNSLKDSPRCLYKLGPYDRYQWSYPAPINGLI